MTNCQLCREPVAPCTRFMPHPFVECIACGFIFRPNLDVEDLIAVYTEGEYETFRGEEHLAEFASRCSDARVRLRYLQKWASSGRLLDVGASAGAFVQEASGLGFLACGIEPVHGFVSMAKQRDLPVFQGTLTDSSLLDQQYEVITLWHVLEHLADPVSQLRRIASALTEQGMIAVEVPNAGSAVAARMGDSWTSLQADVHVNQFTPSSLRTALTAAGLSVLDVHTSTITPYLPRRAQFGLRHLAARAKAGIWLRSLRSTHPSGHELIRAVAQRSL